MKRKTLDPKERFLFCKNNVDFYCKIIKHKISNGYASKAHCGSCKHFKIRK